MSDLHERLIEVISQAEALANMAARDANSARWASGMFRIGLPDMADHIAANDPATVLRGLAEDRAMLDLAATMHAKADAADARARSLGVTAGSAVAEDVRAWADALVASLARRHGVTP
jgi:hypothetical protein